MLKNFKLYIASHSPLDVKKYIESNRRLFSSYQKKPKDKTSLDIYADFLNKKSFVEEQELENFLYIFKKTHEYGFGMVSCYQACFELFFKISHLKTKIIFDILIAFRENNLALLSVMMLDDIKNPETLNLNFSLFFKVGLIESLMNYTLNRLDWTGLNQNHLKEIAFRDIYMIKKQMSQVKRLDFFWSLYSYLNKLDRTGLVSLNESVKIVFGKEIEQLCLEIPKRKNLLARSLEQKILVYGTYKVLISQYQNISLDHIINFYTKEKSMFLKKHPIYSLSDSKLYCERSSKQAIFYYKTYMNLLYKKINTTDLHYLGHLYLIADEIMRKKILSLKEVRAICSHTKVIKKSHDILAYKLNKFKYANKKNQTIIINKKIPRKIKNYVTYQSNNLLELLEIGRNNSWCIASEIYLNKEYSLDEGLFFLKENDKIKVCVHYRSHEIVEIKRSGNKEVNISLMIAVKNALKSL